MYFNSDLECLLGKFFIDLMNTQRNSTLSAIGFSSIVVEFIGLPNVANNFDSSIMLNIFKLCPMNTFSIALS